MAGHAVNPSMGARPRHPCRGRSRYLCPPCLRQFPGDGGQEHWVSDERMEKKKGRGLRRVLFLWFCSALVEPSHARLRASEARDPRLLFFLSSVTGGHRKLSEGGRAGFAGVSAAWARGMPRAGWAGRPTPVLPCAQDSAHEQAAAKPPRMDSRRLPRTQPARPSAAVALAVSRASSTLHPPPRGAQPFAAITVPNGSARAAPADPWQTHRYPWPASRSPSGRPPDPLRPTAWR